MNIEFDKEKSTRFYREFVELNGRAPAIGEAKELLKALFAEELKQCPDEVLNACADEAIAEVFGRRQF